MHEAVDAEQRDALTIDGKFDLLATRQATREGPSGFVEEVHVEAILAVGRKGVNHRHAAARTERRAFHVVHLRRHLRHRVGVRGGARRRVADCQSAQITRRAQIRAQQGGRQGLHIGDVVEIIALGVGREIGGGIDLELQQVRDRQAILRPIEPLERAPAGIRMRQRTRIELSFKGGHECIERVHTGPRRAHRRHHAGPQLRDHFLGDISVRVGRPHVEVGQREISSPHGRIVAFLAVLLHHRIQLDRRHPRHRRRLQGTRAARGGAGQHRVTHDARRRGRIGRPQIAMAGKGDGE